MGFTIKSGSPEKQRSACVVVGVFDNRKLSLSAELIDRASNGYISEIIRRGDMEGKLGSTLLLHNVRGTLADRVTFVEDGLVYRVDVAGGQKTGFYLDQRDNRRIVRSLARGRRVLNVFCYTGGFTLAALAGGAARATSIDSSADAIAQARANVARNASLDPATSEWIEADAFVDLRRLRNAGASFDLIVVDPPKFAPTAAHAERAARAYKDVNLLALKMLEPGGMLATFSCSGGVSAELFQKIVAGAAVDAKADVQIVRKLGASPDHPVALGFPEGEYLKGLLLRRA